MDIFQKLTIVTCVTSSLTLIIVGTALLPHVKNGLVVIRDAVLWAAFVLLIFYGIWFGITRGSMSTGSMSTGSASMESSVANDGRIFEAPSSMMGWGPERRWRPEARQEYRTSPAVSTLSTTRSRHSEPAEPLRYDPYYAGPG